MINVHLVSDTDTVTDTILLVLSLRVFCVTISVFSVHEADTVTISFVL